MRPHLTTTQYNFCTPPAHHHTTTYPTTHPYSTSITRNLRSTFDVSLTTSSMLRTATTTKAASTMTWATTLCTVSGTIPYLPELFTLTWTQLSEGKCAT